MPRQPLLLDDDEQNNNRRSISPNTNNRSAFYCASFNSVFKNCLPEVPLLTFHRIEIVGYVAGALFALGWWLFIDGVSFAATRSPAVAVPISFEDFVPGILSTFSLIIVNLINKETLNADDFSFGGNHVAAKARGCAFIGVTMALSAIIGAISIMCVKYVVPGHGGDTLYFGIIIPVQNILIFAG
ncbi:hypothetical protein HK099_005266 [Clydaea vesicula]|uniref:Uncharacterized protein n=1 Tax=Clydaea vesicula TaxID=447962 RepID=A0AAD5Y3B4_9FUNG|nr:hypothetical protein HK099_005266 [Clydaea vesicula]